MSPFNESLYRELLEGQEINEVNLSETMLNKDFRIDTDFWTKEPIINPTLTYDLIGNILEVSQYGVSIEMNENDIGYPIYRMNEIHNMVCDFEVSKCADLSVQDYQTFKLNDGDVLFNRTNSYEWVGRTGIYKKQNDKDFVFASYLVRLVPNKLKVLPEYLAAFLSCKYGVWDIKRRARHSVNQTNVNPEEVKAIQIPLLNKDIQCNIKALFDKSIELSMSSKTAYSQAEYLLLSALNLTEYMPDRSNTNIKSFSESFGSSGRLDAEYYQPKFDELEQLIQSNGVYWKRISEIEEYNARGCQPEYYKGGKLSIINSKHILEDNLDYDNFEKTNEIFWTLQPKARVQANDILVYTTGANIGRSNIYLSNEKAMASNHVNILRIREEDPFYVSFVMNSFIGRMQTDKLSAGSAQAELYPKDISKFMIPFVEKSIQQQIRENIIESLAQKRLSLALLDTAKRAVEIAIEESEIAALSFIKEKTDNA